MQTIARGVLVWSMIGAFHGFIVAFLIAAVHEKITDRETYDFTNIAAMFQRKVKRLATRIRRFALPCMLPGAGIGALVALYASL